MNFASASAIAPILTMQASTPATIAGAGASVVPIGIDVPARSSLRFSDWNSSASSTPSSNNAFRVRSELALDAALDIDEEVYLTS